VIYYNRDMFERQPATAAARLDRADFMRDAKAR
jgi:hypothetical protein